MGASQSINGDSLSSVSRPIRRLPNTQQLDSESTPSDPLRDFNLGQPSAAVVGAGIAGVHVAYELAQLGFQVTVYDERDEIAGGETKHALPFIGVGLLQPSLSNLSVRREVFRGLFPTSCPLIASREHAFNSLFSFPLHRWLVARMRNTLSDEEVMWYTNNLSRLSVQTVKNIVSKHPALGKHIEPCEVAVSVLNGRRGSRVCERSATAYPRPIMVDPVEWTRALARVCTESFHVRFALGERVESFNTYLKYNVETTRSIRVSKEDPANPDQRLFAEESYDVVVLTAGAKTGGLTAQGARIPVVGLSGLEVTVNSTREPNGMLERLKKLVLPSAEMTGSDGAALVQLSGPCSLFGYYRRPCRDGSGTKQESSISSSGSSGSPAQGARMTVEGLGDSQSSATDFGERLTVAGLLSFDTTESSDLERQHSSASSAASASAKLLSKMETYARVMCDYELPLLEGLEREPVAGVPEVSVEEYVRGFSPDGVPIVDHCGSAFNMFVCCGFGDQATDFAPGSARVLGQLVRHEAELLLREDETNQKELGLAYSGALPSSAVGAVEADMQLLLNGILPESQSATPQATTASTAPWWKQVLPRANSGHHGHTRSAVDGELQQKTAADVSAESSVKDAVNPTESISAHSLVAFKTNPYSTDRFPGTVRKGMKDIELYSLGEYFDIVEGAVAARAYVFREAFRKQISSVARRDGVPIWFKDFVYDYFYYDDKADQIRDQEEAELRVKRAALIERVERTEGSLGGRAHENSATTEEVERRVQNASLTRAETAVSNS